MSVQHKNTGVQGGFFVLAQVSARISFRMSVIHGFDLAKDVLLCRP